MSIDKKRIIQTKYFSKTGESFLNFEQNGVELFSFLHQEGNRICQKYIKGESDFFLVESARKQAVAIHEINVVMVFKGMLDVIFRIASMLAAVTPTPTPISHDLNYPWKERVRFWLVDGDFDWGDEGYWWLTSHEHRVIFDFFVICLFRFVVLHEIGHLHHMHGWRRENAQNGSEEAAQHKADLEALYIQNELTTHGLDPDFPRADSLDARISHHAREIVADTYGFQFLMEETRLSISSNECYSYGAYLDLINEYFDASLLSISSFFWSMSMVSEMNEGSQDNNYPTHAFRLHAIESTALEHGICGLPSEQAKSILASCMKHTIEVMNEISENYDFLRWRLKLLSCVHSEHYKKICEEAGKWSNMKFGVLDKNQ